MFGLFAVAAFAQDTSNDADVEQVVEVEEITIIGSRIKSKTKILLIHGDQDEVVNPTNLLESKDFLVRNNIPVEANMIKNCGHHISAEASSLALKFIKKNFKI